MTLRRNLNDLRPGQIIRSDVVEDDLVNSPNPPSENAQPAESEGSPPLTLREILDQQRTTLRAEGAPAIAVEAPVSPTDFVTATLQRQQSIPIQIPPIVVIVGCGGVGSWLAYFLALAGVPDMFLFDSDTVSETNLNRLPYGQSLKGEPTVGKNKATALMQFLMERRPGMRIECHPNLDPAFADALHLNRKRPYIAVSTDTWASRRAIYDWANASSLHYIEAAAEGDFGSIALSPADWTTPAEDNPGYASVPVWVGPCVAAASMACSYILHHHLAGADTSARFGWNNDQSAIEFTYHADKPPAIEKGKEIA